MRDDTFSGRRYFAEDLDSFTQSRARAWEDCVEAYIRAGSPVAGAAARVAAALHEFNCFRLFDDRLAQTVETWTFAQLPELRDGRERLEGFHRLDVGPWRGIFLVSRDGTSAIGLIFSKHPHDIRRRLVEVAGRYSPESE